MKTTEQEERKKAKTIKRLLKRHDIKLKELCEKNPLVDSRTIFEAYAIGLNCGMMKERNKNEEIGWENRTKEFIDSVFKSGFLAGRITKENEIN